MTNTKENKTNDYKEFYKNYKIYTGNFEKNSFQKYNVKENFTLEQLNEGVFIVGDENEGIFAKFGIFTGFIVPYKDGKRNGIYEFYNSKDELDFYCSIKDDIYEDELDENMLINDEHISKVYPELYYNEKSFISFYKEIGVYNWGKMKIENKLKFIEYLKEMKCLPECRCGSICLNSLKCAKCNNN